MKLLVLDAYAVMAQRENEREQRIAIERFQAGMPSKSTDQEKSTTPPSFSSRVAEQVSSSHNPLRIDIEPT